MSGWEEEGNAKKNLSTSKQDLTQLSDKERETLVFLNKTNPVAGEIYLFLIQRMRSYNAVTCSQSLLIKLTGKSRTTVHRAIVFLKKSRSLGVEKLGTTQVFHSDVDMVWQSYGDINYGEIIAPILLDIEENPELETKENKIN